MRGGIKFAITSEGVDAENPLHTLGLTRPRNVSQRFYGIFSFENILLFYVYSDSREILSILGIE